MSGDKILTNLSENEISAAIEHNDRELWLLFTRLPGAELHDNGKVLFFDTGIPWMNRVLHTQLSSRQTDQEIQAVIEHFKRRNLPFLWDIGPDSQPGDLGDYLEKNGLLPSRDNPSPGMALILDQMKDTIEPPEGLGIERVTDEQMLRQKWGYAFQKGFEGLPEPFMKAVLDMYANVGFEPKARLQHYLGMFYGEPAATATLYYGAGVAGLYAISTIPETRRKGIGSAMTLTPLREARALGYKVGVLSASKMGVSMYEHLGFKKYSIKTMYRWIGESK